MVRRVLSVLVPALVVLVAAPSAVNAASSCVTCHGNPDLFEGRELKIVDGWRGGVHAAAGLGCEACHGGNPDPSLAEDMDAAMDAQYAPNPFHGAPPRTEVPDFCGRCHSDPDFMKRFNPGERVDQEKEYWTSRHGQLLSKGDTKVAVCVDCHGVHPILSPRDIAAPVYPKNVADTCGRCHADPRHMAGYTLPDGRPLPVDQKARWERSVHAAALLRRDDLSAPTCNDCHGNHGATPPGLESIAFVCGQCHGREADLFRASRKHEGFEEHNEYLREAGDQRCAACHEPPEPAASVTRVHAFSECVTCHGNHSVIRPTVAMLQPLPPTPCAFCHEPKGTIAEAVPEPPSALHTFQRVRDELLAETANLEGEARFNALVERAQRLPYHTVAGEGGQPVLRPEFKHLFDKFRIGTTTYTYQDPVTGEERSEQVVRCGDCHGTGGGENGGLATSEAYLNGMWELTGLTARSERIMLAAKRGGVEVVKALPEIDQAVNSQIELEVLVHGFTAAPESQFETTRAEGVTHAEAALKDGEAALRELHFRRVGLGVSLVIIVLVLVALGLTIRRFSARDAS